MIQCEHCAVWQHIECMNLGKRLPKYSLANPGTTTASVAAQTAIPTTCTVPLTQKTLPDTKDNTQEKEKHFEFKSR